MAREWIVIAVLVIATAGLVLFGCPSPDGATSAWAATTVNNTAIDELPCDDAKALRDILNEIEDNILDDFPGDPNPYQPGVYECNNFADYTAARLTEMGYTVKRAMRNDWGGVQNQQHHWVFIIVSFCGNDIWVPIECTPPGVGMLQRDEERLDVNQWPRIEYAPFMMGGDGQPLPPPRFKSAYFGDILTRDHP